MPLGHTFWRYGGKVMWHMSASKFLTAQEISDASGVPKSKAVFCLRVLRSKGLADYKTRKVSEFNTRRMWRIRGRRLN